MQQAHDSMDAEYLRNTVGEVIAKGCAEVIVAAPVDPIEYLSLWLLKYVENAKVEKDFWKKKECTIQEQITKQEKQRQHDALKEEEIQNKTEAINHLRSTENDPYQLFDACLQAVSKFTGCSSAYVALVLDKLWEPPKKKLGTKEEENAQNEEEPEEEEEPDDEEVESSEQPPIEGDKKGDEDDEYQQEDGIKALEDSQGGKKGKQPKPPNYKKKVLLYVAATPDNKYLINRQLDRKLGPVSYTVLLQGLPKLHIANVLYQEGIHFFQGLPRMGAYFIVPIVLNTTSIQVVALLCADTLKKEHTGTGCPFLIGEQDFIAAVSQAASEALRTSLYSVGESHNTKDIMKDLQNQILQIEVSHKNELKRERGNTRVQASKPQEEEQDSTGLPNSQEDQEKELSNEQNALENEEEDEMKDEEDDDNSDKGDKDEAESIAVEGEDEDEQGGVEDAKEDQLIDEQGNKTGLHVAKKTLKKQQKKVSKLEKKFEKCQAALEKQAFKVSKLEKRLKKSTGTLHHLHMLLTTVVDSIIKYKDQEFFRIRQILFPSTTIHRILKALLYVLGHGNATVDNWARSRQLFNDDLCNDFADVELEQMVAEIDLRVAIDEEKKQALHVEELQSANDNANFTNEREISSSPTDEVDGEEEEDAE